MSRRRIYGLFALVCLIFGSTFLAIRIGLDEGASPLFFAALRFVSAGGCMLALLLLTKRTSFTRLRPLLLRSAVLSLFLTVGTFGCMFIAETRVDSGLMARLDGAGPIVTAVFAAVLLGKKLNLRHGMAFVTGSAGVLLMAAPAASRSEPFFLAMAMASVVLYAAGNAVYPRLFRHEEDTVTVSALQSFVGGILLLVAALMLEDIAFTSAAVPALLYLIVGGSIVAHTATLVLVREAGPVFASGWLYAAPVAATALGALVLGEGVGASDFLGILLALGGVFLLNRAETVRTGA
jgi:drug/metabolite transporter (DMT)-like permease